MIRYLRWSVVAQWVIAAGVGLEVAALAQDSPAPLGTDPSAVTLAWLVDSLGVTGVAAYAAVSVGGAIRHAADRAFRAVELLVEESSSMRRAALRTVEDGIRVHHDHSTGDLTVRVVRDDG